MALDNLMEVTLAGAAGGSFAISLILAGPLRMTCAFANLLVVAALYSVHSENVGSALDLLDAIIGEISARGVFTFGFSASLTGVLMIVPKLSGANRSRQTDDACDQTAFEPPEISE